MNLADELFADLLLVPGGAVDRDEIEECLHESVAVDLVCEHDLSVTDSSHITIYSSDLIDFSSNVTEVRRGASVQCGPVEDCPTNRVADSRCTYVGQVD